MHCSCGCGADLRKSDSVRRHHDPQPCRSCTRSTQQSTEISYYETTGTWSGWHSLGSPGGGCTSGPSSDWRVSNDLDVFCRGADGAEWYTWFNGTAWQPWTSLGGLVYSAAGVTDETRHAGGTLRSLLTDNCPGISSRMTGSPINRGQASTCTLVEYARAPQMLQTTTRRRIFGWDVEEPTTTSGISILMARIGPDGYRKVDRDQHRANFDTQKTDLEQGSSRNRPQRQPRRLRANVAESGGCFIVH